MKRGQELDGVDDRFILTPFLVGKKSFVALVGQRLNLTAKLGVGANVADLSSQFGSEALVERIEKSRVDVVDSRTLILPRRLAADKLSIGPQ